MALQPKHYWMLLPVLLLLMSVSIQVTAAVMASQGNSAEIERDYYDRALNWEQHQELVAASINLGWTVAIDADRVPDARATIEVRLRVHDAEGAPLTGARCSLEAFQNGNIQHTVTAEPLEREPGVYTLDMQPRRAGIWVWRLRLERGTDVFVSEQRQQLYGGPAPIATATGTPATSGG